MSTELAISQLQSSEIRQKLDSEFQDETPELQGLIKLILTFAPESFADARGISFKVFFTLKPLKDHAGYCKRLNNTVRFKERVDFHIIIFKEEFEKLDRYGKAKLIIHELHHIGKDEKGQPTVRNHNEKESFCELPTHDIFSETIMERLKTRLDGPALT